MYKKIIGEFGEGLAVQYLLKKKYRIINRNVKLSYQEVDIIARDGEKWVFVEVKTRTTFQYGIPEESINKEKIRNMKRAIKSYVYENSINLDRVRFDVIVVNIDKLNKVAKIKHYPNIF